MMSEVKPTLVSYEAVEETVLANSWLGNFQSGKWIDAQSRGWYWIVVNAVSFPSAYEYKVRFDVPAENITLIFPFVVKTSDKDVKKVFINDVEYKVRSWENYGNRFVVSGREFSFKIATERKLTKRAVPIIIIEGKQAVFRNINLFDITNTFVLRQSFSDFRTTHIINTNCMAIRPITSIFINSSLITCNYITTYTTLSTFNNVNGISVPFLTLRYKQVEFKSAKFLTSDYIRLRFTSSEFNTVKTIEANHIATRNTRVLYITSSFITCNYTTTYNTLGTFDNVNVFSVPVIANCRNTSWARFGGIWQSCETWTS